MRDKWNERYASSDFVYGTEPNEFFKEQILKISPGGIIMLEAFHKEQINYATGGP